MPEAPKEGQSRRTGRRILVTGASGFIGSHVVPALIARGDRVVVLVRDGSRLQRLHPDVEVVEGDIADPRAVGAAVEGAEAVIHLAAATTDSRPDVARRVNVEGTGVLVRAATEAGTRRIVATSSIAIHRKRLGPYASTKGQMEEVLLASDLEVVILRPSLVYGPGSRGLFHRLTRLVRGLPVVPVIGRGRETIEPLHVDDLVRAILFCLEDPAVVGKAYDLVGPEEVTMVDLLRSIERTSGVRKRHVHLPTPVVLAGARALALVMKNPPVTADNVMGADQAAPTDPEPARRDLPPSRITLREGLPTLDDPMPQPAGDGTTVRVVVVGLGRMGITHAALMNIVPGVRVAAAVDVDRRLGKTLQGMGFDVPWFPSLERAIDAVRPHAAVVATPNNTHHDLALLAAERGVGLLVEKPLANTLEDAQSIADAVEKGGVAASCGYVLAYLPAYERAKEVLEAGALGTITSFESSMFLSQVFGPKKGWLYDPAKAGGGVLPNVTSHLLFLLRWYFGEAAEVSASVRKLHTEVEDEATLRLRFRGGVEGAVETSWSVQGYPQSVTSIRIHGENGTLEVDNRGLVLALDAPAGGLPSGVTRIHPADLPQAERYHLVREGYSREGEDFVRVLRHGGSVRTSLPLALDVQAIMQAAYRSSDQGGAAVALEPTGEATTIEPSGQSRTPS